MADDIDLNPGTGGDTIRATEDAGLIKHQHALLEHQVDRHATPDDPLPVGLHGPTSQFGELLTVIPHPTVQANFMYGVHSEIVTTTVANGGTVTANNSVGLCKTFTAVDGLAEVASKSLLSYRPGQGIDARITGYFSTGVAASIQLLGCGDADNGFFFGYDGVSFGILHRDNGVDAWTAATAWSLDKLDGAGLSGLTIDPTTGNVYRIAFPWLGFGTVDFQVMNPVDGRWITVHRIPAANASVLPSVRLPKFPLSARAENLGNTTNLTVGVVCLTAFNQGPVNLLGPSHAFSSGENIPATNINHILSIRNKTTFNAINNKIPLILESLSYGADGNKPVILYMIKGATPGAGLSYSDLDTPNSVVEVAEDTTTLTAGQRVQTFITGNNSTNHINLLPYDIRLQPGETLSFGAKGTTGTADTSVALSWREDF